MTLPHNFRAPTDPQHPEAQAVCDRCGFMYRHRDLVWQYEYRGNALMNIRRLVCTVTCLDVPFQFNRPIILPPDPKPVLNARPAPWAQQETGPSDSGPVYLLVPDSD